MEPFLRQVAKHLVSSYAGDLSELCIVLPNLRAGLFLRKYLGAELGKVSWAPYICSAEDFMNHAAGLAPADSNNVLFSLYEIHSATEGEKAQPLEEFLQWAPQLMKDFDEADRSLADIRQLFSALSDARAITVWNPDHREPTDFQKQYLRFYASLYGYYSMLLETILARKQAWPGLMYRMASLGIERYAGEMPWKKVFFTGFNALTQSEVSVMDHLYRAGKAEFLWDADQYYLSDTSQEAGEFIRRHRKKWGGKDFSWISDSVSNSEILIRIIGVPGNLAQASAASGIIGALGRADERTAVILNDESLLSPLLYTLPSQSGEMNITMGLPLSQTPLAGLVTTVVGMQINRDRFSGNIRKGEKLFYYRDILKLLGHPYLQALVAGTMEGNSFVFEELVTRIARGQKVFYSSAEILGEGRGLFEASAAFLQPFFNDWTSPSKALSSLREIIALLRDHFTKSESRFETDFLYVFSKLVSQVGNLLRDHPGIIVNLQNLSRLLDGMVRLTTMPFSGEPLKGMQIMGMLETRTLDFETIVMLSCNENLLPRAKSMNSFIPLDLRLEFGMPTYRQRDAVSAYHFYRLLQRAKDVYLIYSTDNGEFGSGEMSRYLQQILGELAKSNPQARISHEILSMPVSPEISGEGIRISKDEKIMGLLAEKAAKGFSPTALNNYRACKLKFYFSDLAQVREPEELEEEIDNRILGNIVHDALFRLYSAYLGKTLDAESIVSMISAAPKAADEACRREFSGRDVDYGKNNLLLRVARTMLRRYLLWEKDNLQDLADEGRSLGILELESWLRRKLVVASASGPVTVQVAGKADRIENDGRCVRLIDYKTGSSLASRARVDDWDAFRSSDDKDHAFQLLTYAWLYQPRLSRGVPVEAGIVSLRKVKEGITRLAVPGEGEKNGHFSLGDEDIEQFGQCLESIISEVFDPSVDFVQTANLKTCGKCMYAGICQRG
jgi:hypothetical protein